MLTMNLKALEEKIEEYRIKMPCAVNLKIIANEETRADLSDAVREEYPTGLVCWNGDLVTFIFGCHIEINPKLDTDVFGILPYDVVCNDEQIDIWNAFYEQRLRKENAQWN